MHDPQTARAVLMVRPHCFQPNPETAVDNHFQTQQNLTQATQYARAYDEVGRMADTLSAYVDVHVCEDDGSHGTPDSVFPNNWFSTHADGTLVLYPMAADNRRRERRPDIIDELHRRYPITRTIDLTSYERTGQFLEGTGSMVLDRAARIAYACRSRRMDETALGDFCGIMGYRPHVFDALDGQGQPIYHTNVMMGVGRTVALVGLDTLPDPAARRHLEQTLVDTGKIIVPLSRGQIDDFAGNVLELDGGAAGPALALSERAWRSLDADQRAVITSHVRPVPLDIPTIEMGGGSVRCMLAELFLSPRA